MKDLHKLIDESSKGSDFQKKVWHAIADIPCGEVRTYSQIARIIENPGAVRAVANACGRNPFAPDVPCHRVIGMNHYLGGYSAPGGLKVKLALLREEGYPNVNNLWTH